ncbi:unnamed protein product [Ambrosiozyma monospora]|uniref:Unnamed protein product n=1 Tax=Ambrosiozyma monospora TaxID=43982 RepID=A0ACB5STV6_AMBMO|nr:unnamed protein product [Ambrosiozyma monospora]
MLEKFSKKEAKPFQKSRKLTLGFITALISRPIPKPKSLETQNKTTKSGRPLSMAFIELMQCGQATSGTDTGEKSMRVKKVKRLSLPLLSSNNDDLALQSGHLITGTDSDKSMKVKKVKRLSLPLLSSYNDDLVSPLPTPVSRDKLLDGPVTKELNFQPQHVQDAIMDMQLKISQKHS